MPSNIVKTKKDEKLWKMAQKRTSEQYDINKDNDRFWAITTGIYKRMKGESKSKSASIANKLDKSDFLKLAQELAVDYFKDENKNLTDLVVKTAIVKEMNNDQIQTLCTTTNHLVHSTIKKEKAAQDDQSVEFEIARPEDAIEKVADICEAPDSVYMDTNAIFMSREPEEKEAEEPNYGQEMQRTVRRGQVLKQNIKNIANAHYKLGTDAMIEADKADESVEKLYALVRQAVENGKSPEILRDALGKAFDDQSNFELVWDDISIRLMADGVIKRPFSDLDRGDTFDTQNWSPNQNLPIVATAIDISRRLTKLQNFNLSMMQLEKMAKQAGEDLKKTLYLEKTAFTGAAVKAGLTGWFKKKSLQTAAKGAVKGAVKKTPKKKIWKKAINVIWPGIDYHGASTLKTVRKGGF